jgi:lipopolysaccharide biosynthesis regulator YciM
MRFRTFAGVLGAIATAVAVAYVSNLNTELLSRRFLLTPELSIPVYGALLGVFMVGFLPAVAVLLTQRLRRDLADRRARRRSREERSLEGRFRRAVDFAVDGQWDRAAGELDSVLTERPEDFSSILLQGEAMRRAGRAEEAIEVHRRASVLYPRSSSLLYRLAVDYRSAGEEAVAEQVCDRILRDFPALGLDVLRARRKLALEEREWREAERLQERIVGLLEGSRLGPDEAAAERAVRLGLAYQRAVEDLENDRFEEVGRGLEALLAEEPLFLPALLLRGELERMQGREEMAVERWRQGFAVSGTPLFLQRIEDHFIEREQPMEAIDQLYAIINESEPDLLPRFFLGRLFFRLEMHEEALKSLADLSDEIRISPSYHLLRAQVHHRRGELSEALSHYVAGAEQAGVTSAGFICRVCGERSTDWRACCPNCCSWNAVDLDLTLEGFSPEDLGLKSGAALVPFGRMS